MSKLSYVRYVGDGTTEKFALAINGENMGYFRIADIHGYVNGKEVPILIRPSTPHIVYITPAPAEGAEIIIRREMPLKLPYADFERGNNFGKRQVNNSFLQQLYLTQEIIDGFHSHQLVIDKDIDMNGYKIINLGDADLSKEDEAVNVRTARKIASGSGFEHNKIAGRDKPQAHPAKSISMESGDTVEEMVNLAFVLAI